MSTPPARRFILPPESLHKHRQQGTLRASDISTSAGQIADAKKEGHMTLMRAIFRRSRILIPLDVDDGGDARRQRARQRKRASRHRVRRQK